MKRLTMLITMALLLPGFAWGACAFDKGLAAYNKQDYRMMHKEKGPI